MHEQSDTQVVCVVLTTIEYGTLRPMDARRSLSGENENEDPRQTHNISCLSKVCDQSINRYRGFRLELET